jgi:hypothetical protein
MKKIKKPILFLIFNRLEQTKLVFEEIRNYKPSQFFIAADGPRENNQKDEICYDIRNYVLNNIDWECEIHTLFRSSNLGCGKSVSSAIKWFFDQVEDGIILEDDCLPSKDFFIFCEQMLELYKFDETVMHISGFNYFGEIKKHKDYFFTKHTPIWGWASWARAWKTYDFELKNLDINRFKNQIFPFINNDYNQLNFWLGYLNQLKEGKVDTWDIQWQMTVWFNNGVTILPVYNLIQNIGFSIDALHTKNINSPFASLKFHELGTNHTYRKKKIKIKQLMDDYIFYFAHQEKYDLTISKVKSCKILINPSVLKKIRNKNLSLRDRFYLLREYLNMIFFNFKS